MIKKANVKISLIIIAGVILVILLYRFNTYTQYYFLENNKIQKQFNNIKNSELQLRYNVLMTSVYMYTNNDFINDSIKELLNSLNALLSNGYYKSQYPSLYKETVEYKKLVLKKIDKVYEFQTLNAPIKNSIMYLASLLEELPKISGRKMRDKTAKESFKKNNYYAQKMIKVISSVFLAKSSLDNDFIKNLDFEFFKNYKTDSREFNEFNKVFVANLEVFVKYFNKYIDVLKYINDKKAENFLEQIHEEHLNKINGKIVIIKVVSFSLMIFVLMSVVTVVVLLIRLQKDYEKLKKLNKELHETYITDKLTGLFNRNKFDMDVKLMKKPVLVLINIDRFKHINDYYGIKTGDGVLKKTAEVLKKTVPNIGANIYRLGADDFGIVYEYEKYPKVKSLAKRIIRHFDEHEMEINKIKFHISVSIGISLKKPLLENADIALKYIKKSFRKRVMVYEDDMNAKTEIKQNIERSKILYQAIKENRIEPYFQPIVDTQSGKTKKYEVLARIVHKNGKVESIYEYLQIAKDNKLYADITRIMLKKTYERVANKEVEFNLNISIEDILDISIIRYMYHLYLKNRNLSKRVTFEILESEAIRDYEEIKRFLQRIKYYGAGVAIDDFGSGYSNFEHLMNLNVDYIKIDGSLIRQLEYNNNAYKIVKVISDFAKEIGVKTVAEFVSNEKIYKKVKELGIDLSQGFYFSEPLPSCIT
ncbi:EAL domain-containing protein [Nautilia sp.]